MSHKKYSVEIPHLTLVNPKGYWEKSITEHYQQQREEYMNRKQAQ